MDILQTVAGLGNDPDDTNPCIPDNTRAVCDTDGDGVADGNDLCPTYAGSEANGCDATETLCADAIDNDGDGSIDCADSDCAGSLACPASCNVGTAAPILKKN